MGQQAKPRVGIVVVSHSARIAEGVVELARQMAGPEVRLIAAGGMADGAIGTDAVVIAEAITQADTGAGVLVLADLGSAVLSTKLALDMVDPDLARRTRLSGGPIVEGAIVAAVEASVGDALADVLRAAEGAASMPKNVDQVEEVCEGAEVERATEEGDNVAEGAAEVAGPDRKTGPTTIELEVRNPSGLHARPAANFVQTAARFRSSIWIENVSRGSAKANAKSIVDILGAAVRRGHVIRVSAEGEGQDAAIEALRSLADEGFGEVEVSGALAPAAAAPVEPSARVVPARIPPAPAGRRSRGPTVRIVGTPGTAGIAIGPVWVYEPAPGSAGSAARSDRTSGDPASEIRAAAAEAVRQLEALARRVRDLGRADDAGIFEAQALMATDPGLLDRAVALAEAGMEPASAVESAAETAGATLAAVSDELLAARAADVRDVGARIVRILRGQDLSLPEVPSIAIADDLPPSIAAEIPAGLLLGVALEGGSITAHAVILARGLGIPAIVGAKGLTRAAATAASVAVDGGSGEIVLDPRRREVAEFVARAEALAERRRAAAALRGRPGQTADGERVALLANIGSPEDAPRALEMGAEGVGLFRTEFLFMKRQTPPAEADQVAAYAAAFSAFGPDRPVVVRLADIGGDKAIPYLDLPAEANPFLGVRAIRLAAYGFRELLLTQMRAIWRAAGRAGVTPHVMAPMVATLDDVRLLLELRDEARAAVAATGAALPDRMVSGVMVEIPSAALMAAELARAVDFFSIGTNDLTQYTMAADRGNPALGDLQDGLHPAVLRLIRSVVAGADEAGIPVAVCGELGGDPLGALVLVGLGVDELSADAGSLDGVRAALAGATRAELTDLASRALAATDARAVRAMADEVVRRWETRAAG